MPTESTPSTSLPLVNPLSLPQGVIKCSICGIGNLTSGSSTNTNTNEGIVVLSDPIERICGRCVNARRIDAFEAEDEGQDESTQVVDLGQGLGLGLRGIDLNERSESSISNDTEEETTSRESTPHSRSPRPEDTDTKIDTPLSNLSRSLPAHHPRPWKTTLKPISTAITSTPDRTTTPQQQTDEGSERPSNPLLEVTKARVPSIGRGALYPGSIFRGTQTSGRSAYEVEIQFVDVNFAESSVSGYLSISHLTDSYPHLTTYFDGEIIGTKHGFITGPRYGATEHDDMRHWGRFEQFRRPSTRLDLLKPELYLRDPLPDKSMGEVRARERDFVFLRIKERFLVPDHKVRDISGASFAGFYYALVDLSPPSAPLEPSTPTSPSTPKTPFGPPAPIIIRRGSSQANVRPEGNRRRESSSRLRDMPVRGEATIRGVSDIPARIGYQVEI
uniref:Vacuolar import and degradation protein n=1 Tax=Kwoniella bestiolae CBS 10118 TaxID=1296100 RepID=A0A1B9GEG2_9TREE|nr:hypothetical protein I302_00948 [Kwoniella bestiolae CBS 10118]OCF29443.1 hypothetical protein I302_00948 [Kwoniella bestiolae CBS 10118]